MLKPIRKELKPEAKTEAKKTKHNISEKYNFVKSIKEKEKKVLDYYRRLSIKEEPLPVIKIKRRTKKTIPEKNQHLDTKDDEKDKNKEKGKAMIDKKTKKAIVIMD
jgi:hypothetical protein